jgi:lysophospholipase L1-like esterase
MKMLFPLLATTLLACQSECSISAVSTANRSDAATLSDASPVDVVTGSDVPYVPKQLPRHVLIVGDSEAGRVSWVVQDVKNTDDTILVDAKGGTSTTYWGASHAARLQQSFTKMPNADTIVIFLGTNDVWRKSLQGCLDDEMEVATQNMLDSIQKHGISCVWVGPTNVHGQKWPINDALENKVSPVCSYFNTEAVKIPLEDGVHPNKDEARKWLGMVWLMIPPKFEEIAQ